MEYETNQYLIRFNRLFREIDSLYHELAVKLGISDSVLSILYMVYEFGGKCLQSDICHYSGISRQTINSAIRKMETEQLVYLEPANKRNTIVCLSEKGQDFCKEKIAPVFEMENRSFNTWTTDERKLYLDLTQRYLTNFRKEINQI